MWALINLDVSTAFKRSEWRENWQKKRQLDIFSCTQAISHFFKGLWAERCSNTPYSAFLTREGFVKSSKGWKEISFNTLRGWKQFHMQRRRRCGGASAILVKLDVIASWGLQCDLGGWVPYLVSSKISGLSLTLAFILSFMATMMALALSSAPCLALFSAAPEADREGRDG